MYAKYINERTLDYAPRTITRNGIHYNPYPVDMMLADGYKPVIYTPQPEDEKYYDFRYVEQSDSIIKEWYEVAPPAPSPVEQLRADVDFIAMETGVDLENDVDTVGKSPKYELVKYYYERGMWGKERVHAAVGKWITAEEYEEITGEPYNGGV